MPQVGRDVVACIAVAELLVDNAPDVARRLAVYETITVREAVDLINGAAQSAEEGGFDPKRFNALLRTRAGALVELHGAR